MGEVVDIGGARTGGSLAGRRGGDGHPSPGVRAGGLSRLRALSPAGERARRLRGALEFWDGRTETAWKVSEPTTTFHEGPSRRLVQMATRVEALRGSPIACFGSSDLVRRDAAGRLRWLMQADEVLYLHPARVRLGAKIDVDADPLPDVVLEVDHSTDVRRRKLGIYKEAGFPEIWVLVPWEASVRAPGLAIHVRGDEGYREAAESRAFPGWKAEEIHRALTEDPLSAGARRALERVALAMGAREGTRPEDDPFTRSVSLKAEARGYERGPGGSACGQRARGASGAGHRGGAGLIGGSGALQRAFGGGPDRGGARIHRRGRLPAPGPGAARPSPPISCPETPRPPHLPPHRRRKRSAALGTSLDRGRGAVACSNPVACPLVRVGDGAALALVPQAVA